MKRHSTILMAIVGLALFSSSARAQEYEGCFLVDPKGRVIELEGLCPSPVVPSEAAANGLPPVPGVPSSNIGDGIIRVPIKYRAAGTPVVDVKFNGSQTFEMLVDTGATGTVITPAMADALGIEETGTAIFGTASAREVEMPLGLVQSIDVGGVTIQNVEVSISDALDLGLLGQDLLGQYDITIRNDVIEFHTR
jgi:predicted aspartyl protease